MFIQSYLGEITNVNLNLLNKCLMSDQIPVISTFGECNRSNRFLFLNIMDIKLTLNSLKDLENENIKVDAIKFQKMLVLFNSLEQGWTIKKRNDSYVFTKYHENKKEIFDDSYLLKFMKSNLDLNKVIC